jgi:hypothetical protein
VPKVNIPVLETPLFSGLYYGNSRAFNTEIKDYVEAVGYVGRSAPRPTPGSKYVASDFFNLVDKEYEPPLLKPQLDSYIDGLRKYTRTKRLVCDTLCTKFLEALNITFRAHLDVSRTLSYDQAVELLSLEKSPGFPYYYNCADKGNALERYNLDYIVESEILHGDQETIYSTTLKDELRIKGKYARLFTPAPLHNTIIGNILYNDQNEQLSLTRTSHPIKLGIQMPGHEINNLFFQFDDTWLKFHIDIRGFDTSFPLSLAAMICEFRRQFIPPKFHLAHKQYYNKVYCGYVSFLSYIMWLVGQRSGSTNTFTDNSYSVVGMLLVAASELTGISLLKIWTVFRIIDGSDDVMWAVHPEVADKLTLTAIAQYCHEKFGYAFESPNLEPCLRHELYFFSHHLVLTNLMQLNLGKVWLAVGNIPKILSGFCYVKTNNKQLMLNRFAALLICLFPDQTLFSIWRRRVNRWASRQQISSDEWKATLALVNSDWFFMKIHTGVPFIYRKLVNTLGEEWPSEEDV